MCFRGVSHTPPTASSRGYGGLGERHAVFLPDPTALCSSLAPKPDKIRHDCFRICTMKCDMVDFDMRAMGELCGCITEPLWRARRKTSKDLGRSIGKATRKHKDNPSRCLRLWPAWCFRKSGAAGRAIMAPKVWAETRKVERICEICLRFQRQGADQK